MIILIDQEEKHVKYNYIRQQNASKVSTVLLLQKDNLTLSQKKK